MIRPMRRTDAKAVETIYLEGIATRNATFDREWLGWALWDKSHLPVGRLVMEEDGQVIGWAAMTRISSKPPLWGAAEVSVYMAEAARGRGLGKQLMHALLEECDRLGFWSLMAAIFVENEASIRLHRALGFQDVGIRHYGYMMGRWRDVLMMERLANQDHEPVERPW